MVRNYVRKRPPKEYSKQQLEDAISAVRAKQMTIYRASKHYRIPQATLFKRIKGLRGVKSLTMGRSPAIPLEIEAKMAACIKTMERWGFGLSKKEILLSIGQYVKENGLKTPFKNSVPGDDYFANFKRRHRLSQKKPQAVEVARKKSVDPFVIADYFKLLKEVTLNVPPERIFNIDETSFCTDPSRVKVVGEKGKAAHRVTAGPGRENFSVLMGGNAAGAKLPPLIIFKGKNVWDTWLASKENEYPGITYTATANGWMETKTFVNYFQRTFLKNIPKERPVVLIYDGHSSHTSIGLVEKAIQAGVVILKLPAHTSHLLQPMDLSVFKPLKQQYDEAIIKWQRKNYGKKLPKSVFSTIISQVWKELSEEVIKNGFRKAGIFPFCDSVIPKDKFDIEVLNKFNRLRNSNNDSTMTDGDENLNPSCSKFIRQEQDNNQQNETDAHPEQHNLPLNICKSIGMQDSGSERETRSFPDEKSFEMFLLEHIKQTPLTLNKKRKKICPGSEVITSSDYLQKMKEQKVEENTKQKRKRKQDKKRNKVLLQKGTDSTDDEQQSFSGQSDSNDEIDWEKSPSPPVEEEIHREPHIADFVLIKFPAAGTKDHIHYVAKVLQCFDQEVEVSCLRKSSKIEGKYYFPDVEDISVAFKHQIVFVLPKPTSLQQFTKRQKCFVSFPISLDQYNVR